MDRMHSCITLLSLLILAVVSSVSADVVNEGGNLIAILASGDIGDFGYNNAVNVGRINMERTLNISGSLFAPNIEDEASALALMKELVSKGYKLIISTTTAHVNAPFIAARLFPNVSFVMSGGNAEGYPNLSSLNWSGPDQYFAAGVFCGAITRTNKVGFIHPGPPLASLATLNAFYVGVRSVKPDCEVLTVYTDSYLNPDRTTGAAEILLSHGIDMLVGQQDDLTHYRIAMNHGFLAVGTTGFSLRDIFGESVGVSTVRNWGGPFATYAKNALTGVYKQNITGGFRSKLSHLDTPSHLVPADVWANVQSGVELLLLPQRPYYCTSLVAELGLGETNGGCLLNNSAFAATRLSGIDFKGTYHVPLKVVEFPQAANVAIIVIASILYLFACAIGFAMFWLRRDTVMLAASPVFLIVVLIGVALCFSSAIIWVTEPTKHLCSARIWLPSVGFTLCMGAMIIKNVRLMIIFDAQLRKIRIRDSKLLMWISCLLAVDIILLAVYTAIGKPFVRQVQGMEGLDKYEVRNVCDVKPVGDDILYAIISWHIAQLAVGCFVTFKIRVIDIEEFNESRPFGLCIYIASLVFTIAGILIGTGDTTHVQVIIIFSLSMLIGSAAVLFILFAPKFLTIFMKGTRTLDSFLQSTMQPPKKGYDGSNNASSGSMGSGGYAKSSKDRQKAERSETSTTSSVDNDISMREVQSSGKSIDVVVL